MPTHAGEIAPVDYAEPFEHPADDTTIEVATEILPGTLSEQPPFIQFSLNHDGEIEEDAWGVIATIHAMPEVIDAGHIDIGVTGDLHFDLILWNGSETPVTLTDVVQINPDGTLFVPPATPMLITPETSYTYDVTVYEIGDPVQDTTFQFTFDSVLVLEVKVVATRTVFVPPEVPVPKNVIFIEASEGRHGFKELEPDDLPLETRAKPFFEAEGDVEFQLALGRSALEGEMYYNTTTHNYRYYDGTSFQDM